MLRDIPLNQQISNVARSERVSKLTGTCPDSYTGIKCVKNRLRERSDLFVANALTHVKEFQSRAEFEQHTMASDAVVRCIEIIGEAATKVVKSDPRYARTQSALPWEAMSTMRNKLIHDYFEVDYEAVWQTVKTDLPALRTQIADLLGKSAGR